MLIARAIQVGLGAWMLASVFVWPHSRLQAVVAWSGGGLTIILAVVSIWLTSFRMLLGLAGGWILLGSVTSASNALTVVNNVVCALAILALTFVPRPEIRPMRRPERGGAH